MGNEGRPLGLQYGSKPAILDPIWVVIRETRLAKKLSTQEVARMAGVAPSTVSRGERGFHTWLEKTRKVADALNIIIFTAVIDTGQVTGDIE
jgi:transcriptional regulator with XRE-family HTH domain